MKPRRDRDYMRYLSRLIKAAGGVEPHPTAPANLGKRSNWLHFCHRCGCDLSCAIRGARYCPRCERERASAGR